MPEIDERIWSRHCKGETPAEIDRDLGLEPGAARRVIAGRWAADASAYETEKKAEACRWRR